MRISLDAYSAALQPAATAGENQTYGMEIDNVTITRLNTSESANLLVNESFEDYDLRLYDLFPLPPGVNEAIPERGSFSTIRSSTPRQYAPASSR